MLAQVFDQLKRDSKKIENREIFIDYVGFHTILPYLTYKTNKALLGSAVDVLLQMAMESSKYFNEIIKLGIFSKVCILGAAPLAIRRRSELISVKYDVCQKPDWIIYKAKKEFIMYPLHSHGLYAYSDVCL